MKIKAIQQRNVMKSGMEIWPVCNSLSLIVGELVVVKVVLAEKKAVKKGGMDYIHIYMYIYNVYIYTHIWYI